MSIQDENHKTNVYRQANTGFLAKCICGWQKEYKLKEYLSNSESEARKDAESSATQHLQESVLVKNYLSRIGTKGGKTRSPKKAHSSSQNGKRGGRPIAPVDVDSLSDE